MGGGQKKNRLPEDPNLTNPGPGARPGTSGSKPWAAMAVCGLLLLAVGLVFGQSLRHDFVTYDDDLYVYENPQVIGGLTAPDVAWSFTTVARRTRTR